MFWTIEQALFPQQNLFTVSGGSRISRTGEETPTQEVKAQPIILAICFRKLSEIEKNGRGKALRSTNVN